MIETPGAQQTPVSGLFARVYRDILANRSRLPSMPDVAIRLRAAMQRDNCNVSTVTRIVQADAGTAAYLVRVANSPVYRGRSNARNLEQAVGRLGLATARNLVTAYAMRAMFQTRSEALGAVMREVWVRSARLAALSAVIARRCRGVEADRALLAGLLQDIGMLPLIGALEDARGALPDAGGIVMRLECYAAKVGVVLLRQWEFDAEMVEVARSRKAWLRDPQPEAQLADLVLVARRHASAMRGAGDALPAIESMPAYRKLNLGDVTLDDRLEFLLEADADVKALMATLGVSDS